MAGIYLHIPFCSTKCHYCNFVSTVSLKHKNQVLNAIIRELEVQKNYLNYETVETIYFGGGTPTILSISELSSVLNAIKSHYSIQADCEITMEANPDDLNLPMLMELRKMGVNRLSIGTQAFDDDLLKQLNRRHTANQSIEAVKMAQSVGYQNINIDLIYGIPGLNNEQWLNEIQKAISLNINHISAYHLTVEPGTALEILIKKQKYPEIDDEIGMHQFEILMNELQNAGFEHYEISNFALPNQYSKHNTNYWMRKKYLGIGPSAHSYNLVARQWNCSNLKSYFEGIQSNIPVFEIENLSRADHFNEFIMLALRTQWGVSIQYLQNHFPEFERDFLSKTLLLIDRGLMLNNGANVVLTQKGKQLADGIAADFFV